MYDVGGVHKLTQVQYTVVLFSAYCYH